jgi:nicotinamide phosphoribosyltransferase
MIDVKLIAEYIFQKRLITEVYPSGIVSLVSDSFSFWDVISKIAPALKDDILNRQPNAIGLAKTVFRPDSGDPVKVICGNPVRDFSERITQPESFEEFKEWVADDLDEIFRENLDAEGPHYGESGVYQFEDKVYEVTYKPDLDRYDKIYYYVVNCGSTVSKCNFVQIERTPEQIGAVETLWNVFGGTVNEEGYKVLHERVGLIYGDSITLERAEQILERLKQKGFASCNIVFGIGSYTYQYNTRDTFGFAMKATYGVVNGEGREIFKDPITDNGTKKSAKGLLRVEKEDGVYVLHDQQEWHQECVGELKTVFLEGAMVREQTLTEIRKRVAKG